MESDTGAADDLTRRVQRGGRDANTLTARFDTPKQKSSIGPLVWTGLGRHDSSLFLWMKSCGEAVEIAFDDENGDIIAKSYVFRKIRRVTEDVVHERFRGERRAAL